MPGRLATALALRFPPLAILLTDEKPEHAAQFKEGGWGCVAAMLRAAAKGKVVAFDRATYGCPGGGTGLGFGDCYAGFPIDRLLSSGGQAELADGRTFDMGEGERFFASPAVAARWAAALPYRDVPAAFVVCKPLEQVAADETVALVLMFANPDQLSALVTLAGYRRGAIDSVASPWGAACQSILFALAEAGREPPRGVIGFFDISQRARIDRDLLSFTVPHAMFLEMEGSVAGSFLEADAWRELRDRNAPAGASGVADGRAG